MNTKSIASKPSICGHFSIKIIFLIAIEKLHCGRIGERIEWLRNMNALREKIIFQIHTKWINKNIWIFPLVTGSAFEMTIFNYLALFSINWRN
jgi:hypothetical protein